MSSKKFLRQARVLEKLEAEFAIANAEWEKQYDAHVKDGNRYYLSPCARWYYLQGQIQNLHHNMKGK